MSREMDIPQMGQYIVQHLNEVFTKNQMTSIDLVNIKTLCELFKPDIDVPGNDFSGNLSNLSSMSSPNFSKQKENSGSQSLKQKHKFLTSEDFLVKYGTFIKIIYAALRLGLSIFSIDNDIVILQNNMALVASINNHKKKLVNEHVNTLKNLHTQIGKIGQSYEEYLDFNKKFLTEMKVLDRIHNWILLYVEFSAYHMSDNLIEPVLVYFYKKIKIIEKYTCK
jgi:hypothetical protein